MAAALLNPVLPLALRPPRDLKSIASAVTCGPRDNRGPLVRGRTLSTEAILAIQALKRARGDDSKIDHVVSTALSRLVKPDLVAALAELQRQDHWRLALRVFAAARREPWYKTDYALYANMAAALSRSGAAAALSRSGAAAAAEIDLLVSDLVREQKGRGAVSSDDIRGLARLAKALVAAGRGKALRDVYGMMKREGCVPDEFLFRILIRGLRRLGEEEVAGEVERDFEAWRDGDVLTEPLPV